MDDLKAKLDALSAKAIDGNWMAPPYSSVVGCGIVSAPQGRVVGSGVDADTTAFITELVNAYRTGQLIVAPASAPTDALQEVELIRSEVFAVLRRHDVSEQCFAEVAMVTHAAITRFKEQTDAQ